MYNNLLLNKVLRTAFVMLVIATVFTLSYLDDKASYPKEPVSFHCFDTSEIQGKLENVLCCHRPQYFNLMGDTLKYYFVFMYEVNTKEPMAFGDRAMPGDSIVKHSNSNILMLFKKARYMHYYYYYIDKKRQRGA